MTAIITTIIAREEVDPVISPRSRRTDVAAARTNLRPAVDIWKGIGNGRGNGNENGNENGTGIGNKTSNARWPIDIEDTMRAEDSGALRDWATIPAAAGVAAALQP